jgi:hypothetical protein
MRLQCSPDFLLDDLPSYFSFLLVAPSGSALLRFSPLFFPGTDVDVNDMVGSTKSFTFWLKLMTFFSWLYTSTAFETPELSVFCQTSSNYCASKLLIC